MLIHTKDKFSFLIHFYESLKYKQIDLVIEVIENFSNK